MRTVACYNRWQGVFEGVEAVNAIRFTAPDGKEHRRPVFLHQPTNFAYDVHGYETISPVGDTVWAARFTPDQVGRWRYVWLCDEHVVQEGWFTCTESDHPGFVEISRHDPRYFAFTNGEAYVPIGLNLCLPQFFAMSTGQEFKTSDSHGTLGARDYECWFRSLADNGGNYARLWLGGAYFQAETDVAGELDLLRFAALDRVVELARQYGIRLKLSLEHFRLFGDGSFPSRVLHHPDDGRTPASMDEWFQSPDWQTLWRHKVDALLARYGDDPVVMAWELWNEINCCFTSSFQVQEDWTRKLLRDMKAASPRNLVTNSLGSYDYDGFQALQDAFKMDAMDFQQVHRYLDQGASLKICTTDPVALTTDAIRRARRLDRPVLLAETGAVNDCHSSSFRYYRTDHDGLIFYDVTYSPFFAGAAGSGHIWHWDSYVDQKNLWHGFRALADAVHGIAVDREEFTPVDQSTDDYWCLLLRGSTVSLAWLRNRADRWDFVLRDSKVPPRIESARIDLTVLDAADITNVEVLRPWDDDGIGDAIVDGSSVILPAFRHGLICRLQH
ncbi:MAG TPA: cellulase family glycosylhydrolase [Armatimonadota bacterium]|nr:cellulase family glycosylhydrolase [Armatimonadota bacterium]